MSFPRAFDQGPFDVAEIKNGKTVAYPNAAVNRLSLLPKSKRLVSVHGLAVDAQDGLRLLDLGKIKDNPVTVGGPKLVCINLKTNRIVQTILFPAEIAGPDAYLNDVRIDLAIGCAGTAFITDSSEKGPNGIIVVDLASGTSRRCLNDNPSVKAESGFTPLVEGQPLLKRKKGQAPLHDTTGVDGLMLSADGKYPLYCPMKATISTAFPRPHLPTPSSPRKKSLRRWKISATKALRPTESRQIPPEMCT